ncbi:CGLAU_01105 family protein [Corynebacterium sp. Q4381]|uniref:CGLAU_01105 family protein n=1 Tax=Corynebacterium sp. Marseille-Q4381 TaxID=3121597 RepID=UPI002FE6312C
MTEHNNINDNINENLEAAAESTTEETSSEVRDNLREAGDALLAAGSAIGAAFGKFAEGLPERFKIASDSARETLNSANTEGEVRSWAANVTNEAEKAFNSLRERDLKFTDDAKASLSKSVADIRQSFNERLDRVDASGSETAESTLKDLRTRFDDLVERIQDQFTSSEDAAGRHEAGDIIDGEIVDNEGGSTAADLNK